MAGDIPGSEENLPLSQESFRQLLNQLQNQIPSIMNGVNMPSSNVDANTSMFTDFSWGAIQIPVQEQSQQQVNVSETIYAPSSLPGTENWPGPYSFNVAFGMHDHSKRAVWCYSKAKNKLFVGKDVPCPISFSTNGLMTDDVSIRAMAYFTSPDSANDPVERCINHSMEEVIKGVFEAYHLIRSESNSFYEIDQLSRRHSVVVPYENPPAGQDFSTYIFKFRCFGSCSGGPNRRPMILVFTLEKGNKVIGRKKIDLKVCACPYRDMQQEDRLHTNNENGKRKNTSTKSGPPKKKTKTDEKENGPFIIKVKDKAMYDFLKQMKNYYKIYYNVRAISPNVLAGFLSNSSEDEQTS